MVGRRTVGCCSHIATLIFYLSYYRHLDFELSGSQPASFLNSVLVTIGSDSELSDEEFKETNSNGKAVQVTSQLSKDSMKHSLSFATTKIINSSSKRFRKFHHCVPIVNFLKKSHHGAEK